MIYPAYFTRAAEIMAQGRTCSPSSALVKAVKDLSPDEEDVWQKKQWVSLALRIQYVMDHRDVLTCWRIRYAFHGGNYFFPPEQREEIILMFLFAAEYTE